jgi:hypothetical protein
MFDSKSRRIQLDEHRRVRAHARSKSFHPNSEALAIHESAEAASAVLLL